MVRVAIVPVGQRDGAWLAVAKEPDHVDDLRVRAGDAPIRPTEVPSPRGAEHDARFLRFRFPLLRCAVRTQLAPRQIAQAHAKAAGRMDGNRATEPYLEVIRVGAENE